MKLKVTALAPDAFF